jgi:hypothetical protein
LAARKAAWASDISTLGRVVVNPHAPIKTRKKKRGSCLISKMDATT